MEKRKVTFVEQKRSLPSGAKQLRQGNVTFTIPSEYLQQTNTSKPLVLKMVNNLENNQDGKSFSSENGTSDTFVLETGYSGKGLPTISRGTGNVVHSGSFDNEEEEASSRDVSLIDNECQNSQTTNNSSLRLRTVYNERCIASCKPRIGESDLLLGEASGDSLNVIAQKPTESPWGPPHSCFPDTHTLSISNAYYNDLQFKRVNNHENKAINYDQHHRTNVVSFAQDYRPIDEFPPVSSTPIYSLPPVEYYYSDDHENQGTENRTLALENATMPVSINVPTFQPMQFDHCLYSKDPYQKSINLAPSLTTSETSENVYSQCHGFTVSNKDDTTEMEIAINRPPSIICYICGKEYGTASIEIHEKQCLKIWRKKNNQLPQEKRLPEPVKLAMSSQPRNSNKNHELGTYETSNYDINTINQAAFESFQLQYVKCDGCGRTFLPERLKVHLNGCRGYHNIC